MNRCLVTEDPDFIIFDFDLFHNISGSTCVIKGSDTSLDKRG